MLPIYKEITKQVKTPCYVFDTNELKKRVTYLKNNLPDNVNLCFALKANPFLATSLKNIVNKFELCSYGEYKIAANSGIKPAQMVVSGVYKNYEELKEIISLKEPKILITIESLNQLDMIEKIGQELKITIKVLLRLTSNNQFGLSKNEVIKILENRYSYQYLNIIGLHYFSGTQHFLLKHIKKDIDYIDEFLTELKNNLGYLAEELELGLGLPVSYFKEEKEFTEKEFLTSVSSYLKAMTYQGHITLELGRSISSSCGTYLTKVVDLKNNAAGNFAIVDGGINHITYYGQMMAMKHPDVLLYPARTGPKESYNICGSLCTINDILVKDLEVSNIKIGDILAFKRVGAYAMTEGISLFLSRDLPNVVLINDNHIEVVRNDVKTYPLNMARKEK